MKCLLAFCLALTAAASASATPFPSGSLVYLRNSVGLNVTCSPGGVVATTTSADAWEQWQLIYPGGGQEPYLLSYFGQRLIWNNAAARLEAAPVLPTEPFSMALHDFPGNNLHPSEGERFWIVFHSGAANRVIYSSGPSIQNSGTAASPWSQTTTQYPVTWFMSVVGNPKPGRLAAKVAMTSMGFMARASDGTYANPGSGWLPYLPVHTSAVPNQPVLRWPNQSNDGSAPLTYGSMVWMVWDLSSGSNSIQPATASGSVPVLWAAYHATNAAESWTVLDPKGAAPAGARVPEGEPVCLRSQSGKLLSANPSSAPLALSPNGCGATNTWEHWTFVHWQR